ncbi:hypothetical protein V1511DRAFT_80560 [Dipodascopsis uninucleata]
MSMTLQSVLPAPSTAPAIFIPGRTDSITYEDFHGLILEFRRVLVNLNIPRQSAVAIALPNTLEFAVAFLAITFSGYIAAPLNPALKQSEFEFYLDDLKCPVAFIQKNGGDRQDIVRAARKVGNGSLKLLHISFESPGTILVIRSAEDGRKVIPQPTINASEIPFGLEEDVALILHTSGTTGRPKVVPLTHRNLVISMKNIVNTYKLTASDRGYLVMPLFHVHGLLCGFLAPLSVHCAVIIPNRFSATQFWVDFIKYKANWYTAVPTIHQILLKSPMPSEMPKIRFIRSCSSALAPSTFHALEKAFKAPVIEAYAMTEASHQMTSNELPPGQRKPGSVGVGQGVEVRILDQEGNEVHQGQEGEICVRGGNVTKGYRNNESANKSSFTREGFFRTGDQGKVDPQGFVFITGRIKELINRGGEKISPVELDGIMLEIPGVSEAVSFAVPDEMYGQEVHAAVVLKPNEKVTEAKIKEFMANRVAKFKVPKKIYFTNYMPKTATGKIQRKNVAAAFFGTSGDSSTKAKSKL